MSNVYWERESFHKAPMRQSSEQGILLNSPSLCMVNEEAPPGRPPTGPVGLSHALIGSFY